MQITRFKIQYLPTTMLILVGVLVWVVSFSGMATAGTYADSAHGNNDPPPDGYGVNRSEAGHDMGDCANCHDTFDSSTCSVNHRMLFNAGFVNQKSGVCMKCHQEAASHQEGGVLNNYDYSRVRGGETDKDCPASIRKQFWFIKYDTREPQINCGSTEGSAHDLKNIRGYMKGKWGWGGTNTEVNPCGTCHNPHKATREYPCSKPSSHSGTWEIWGDDPVGSGKDEKMSEYTFDLGGVYQPPNNEFWTDADQAPAYNTLCMDCHSGPIPDIFTYRWDRDLVSLGWFEQRFSETGYRGNRHGAEPRNTSVGQGTLKSPYNDDENTNYILMCTDCHEPHGSKNYMLLRTCVNGTPGLSIPEFTTPVPLPAEKEAWMTWCEACHTMTWRENHMESSCNECHHHYTYNDYGKF